MSRKWYIIILLLLGLATRFLYFGHPNETVFDEVHFGKFISAYYNHNYYYDIHPPLGKLIIAGFASFFDFKPEFAFSNIGDKFPNKTYLALRFLPALAGSLLPLVLFFVALRLGLSNKASFAAGLFVILENAFLTNSRLILMDSFLYIFGFLSLLFYLRYRQSDPVRHRKSYIYTNLIFFGLFAALAASIKWTGLTFLALAGLAELFFIFKQRRHKLGSIRKMALFFGIVPFLTYFVIFAIHFSLLPKSGMGDAFMNIRFQKTLEGNVYQNNPDIQPYGLFDKFIDLNKQMYLGNKRLTATHPYSSQWYSWPFMLRPVYFWVKDLSRIYFIGNPIIWWASTIGISMLFIGYLTTKKERNFTSSFIIGGYILNLLPFMGIGRVMFLYHYMIALTYSILALAYLIDKEKGKKAKITLMVLIITGAAMFVYFSPLNYGLPLTPDQYQNRIWIKSWL